MYPHRETHITSDMCTGLHISHTFPTHILHTFDLDNASSLLSLLPRPRGCITQQPYWKRIHISQVICVQGYTHYTYIIVTTPVHYVLRCRGKREIHITRQPYWKGVHISQVICVRGYTYDGDTYTIVTMPVHYVVCCRAQGGYTEQLYCSYIGRDYTYH